MSAVNDQVTDAVTQINALLTGGAASQSMGMLDIASAETMGMSMFNAITAQQNSQTSASAAVTASCAKMLKTEVPALPDKDKKEQLALALLQIEMAEQKVTVNLAVNIIYDLCKQIPSATKPADVTSTFKLAKAKAEKTVSVNFADKSQLLLAGTVLTVEFEKIITSNKATTK